MKTLSDLAQNINQLSEEGYMISGDLFLKGLHITNISLRGMFPTSKSEREFTFTDSDVDVKINNDSIKGISENVSGDNSIYTVQLDQGVLNLTALMI